MIKISKKNKLIIKIFRFLIFNTLYTNSSENLNLNKWHLPSGARRYHEVTFLTSHNSFSNEEDGYLQPQQKWNLENQLINGVRGFMLDTHYSSVLFGGKKKIRLCHNNCALTQMVLRPFKGRPMSFVKALKLFKYFLEKNREEVITLFLENYTDAKDLDDAIESSGIQDFVLTPKIWNPNDQEGWPEISWMQKNNKRLVIFNQRGETKYIYDEWSCHFENQHGTININQACKERLESLKSGKLRDRYIYVMNYFPHFYIKPIQKINFDQINSQGVRKLLNKMLKSKGHIKRYPNFIAIDFVNEGNLLALVNKINKMAYNVNLRKKMYRKLSRYIE